MFPMKSLLILLPIFCLTAPARGQTPAPAIVIPALKDEDAAKVLEQITVVQREFAKAKKEVVASALERFTAAAVNDVRAQDFFLAAYRVMNLDRKPAATKEELEERKNGEWQKKAAESLGEGPVSTALRMQLQLLVMLLESTDETRKPDATVAALRDYMLAVAAFLPQAKTAVETVTGHRTVATVGGKNRREAEQRAEEKEITRRRAGFLKLLRQKVMASDFAEAYNLTAYIDAPKEWPQAPVEFAAAYSNVILPWYRANKPSELTNIWDEYLASETALQQFSLEPAGQIEWGAKEYKQLSWSKWLDHLVQGVAPTIATQELMKIIRENPSHPALKTWITDLAKVAESIGGLKFEATPPPAEK